MRKHHPARKIKFCPLCGSDVVTHLGHNEFVCGTGDPQIEAEGKFNRTNARCNRVFGVVYPVQQLRNNTKHRQEIGKLVDDAWRQHVGNNP